MNKIILTLIIITSFFNTSFSKIKIEKNAKTKTIVYSINNFKRLKEQIMLREEHPPYERILIRHSISFSYNFELKRSNTKKELSVTTSLTDTNKYPQNNIINIDTIIFKGDNHYETEINHRKSRYGNDTNTIDLASTNIDDEENSNIENFLKLSEANKISVTIYCDRYGLINYNLTKNQVADIKKIAVIYKNLKIVDIRKYRKIK